METPSMDPVGSVPALTPTGTVGARSNSVWSGRAEGGRGDHGLRRRDGWRAAGFSSDGSVLKSVGHSGGSTAPHYTEPLSTICG